MNDSAVRTLAGVGGSGTVISMQNLLGKSAFTLGLDGNPGPVGFDRDTEGPGCAVRLTFGTDGTIKAFTVSEFGLTSSITDAEINEPVNIVNLGNTTKFGIGNASGSVEVRVTGIINRSIDGFSRIFSVAASGAVSAAFDTGFVPLTSDKTLVLGAPGGPFQSNTAEISSGTITFRIIGSGTTETLSISYMVANKSGI